MDNQNIKTLCIPRVNFGITEPFVRNIFNSLNIGVIGRIDLIKKQNEKGGQQFIRIFVHINKWYNNETSNMAKERLLNGKDIKIIYDDPWFWKVSVYKDLPPTNYHYKCVYNYGNDNDKDKEKDTELEKKEDDDDNWRKPRKNKLYLHRPYGQVDDI